MPSRHRLRSARTHRLEVPSVRHATIGDRTFRAAGSRPWNGLPNDVVDCQTVDSRYIPSAAETFLFQCFFFMTFRATVVSGLTYAASAWRGLTKASVRQRINSVLDRTRRHGYCPRTCRHLMNCVTPPTKNYSVKLSNYHITSYTHYSYHHPPHHRTIISDTAPTHWNCLHTPHT